MKVKVGISISANAHSSACRDVDTEDLGFSAAEWRSLTEEEKHAAATEYWAANGDPEIWFEDPVD